MTELAEESIETTIEKEPDIVTARVKAKAMAEELGFGLADQTRIATAVSELTRNALQYGGKGKATITPRNNPKGLEIVVMDHGPGIENVELAMRDGYSTTSGLGFGLGGAKRLMDEFKIETKLGKGTTITVKKWL